MLRKPELSAGLMDHLARKQTLPTLQLAPDSFVTKGYALKLFVATEGKDGNGLKIEKIGCVF